MRFFARILSILLVIIFFTSHLVPVFAADNTTTTTTPITMPETEQGVPNDIHTLTQSIILGMLTFATCALDGIDFTHSDHRCLGFNPTNGKLGYASNSTGITGLLVNGIAFTFQKPLGTSDYLHYLSSNFGVVKQTYAANQGFDQLSPLMTLWISMRNVAYILFVLIFVIVGFAIMLRAKIDPRTAMTIENQIPKLIIALLLISFSYAIAGFVVDIMWVLIFITINLFASVDPNLANQMRSITSGIAGNPFDLANSITGGGGYLGIATQAAGGAKDIANATLLSAFKNPPGDVIKWILVVLEPGILLSCITNIFNLGGCVDNNLSTAISSVGWLIAFLIFTIAIIVALVKLWWQLIKSYALFIIYVVFAAPMIMLGVLPGSKINFDNWIRHILAYLLVFPTAIGILLLGKVIMDGYGGKGGFTPPLLGIPAGASQALGPILGFAIIMLLPQALTIVQDALQAPDLKYLPGVGQGFVAGTALLSSSTNKIWERAWRPRNQQTGIEEGWLRSAVMGNPNKAGQGFRGNLRRFFEGTRIKP